MQHNRVALERIHRSSINQSVRVTTCQCGEARIKTCRGNRHRVDTDVVRKYAVQLTSQARERSIVNRLEIHVHDLTSRVNTGIGSTCDSRGWSNIRSQNDAKRLLQGLLHGPQPRLRRPAVEVSAVIGEVDSESHR